MVMRGLCHMMQNADSHHGGGNKLRHNMLKRVVMLSISLTMRLMISPLELVWVKIFQRYFDSFVFTVPAGGERLCAMSAMERFVSTTSRNLFRRLPEEPIKSDFHRGDVFVHQLF